MANIFRHEQLKFSSIIHHRSIQSNQKGVSSFITSKQQQNHPPSKRQRKTRSPPFLWTQIQNHKTQTQNSSHLLPLGLDIIALPLSPLVRHYSRRLLHHLVLSLDNIIDLEIQRQVENHSHGSRDGEARLHDEHDGVHEPAQALVVALVGKHRVKVAGHERGAVAQRQRSREDEAVAAVEGDAAGDDGDTRHGDGAEEEGRHAAEDGRGDGDEGGGELGKDAHDDEEEAAAVAGGAVGAAREGDDAVVLRERGHGGDGAEGGHDADAAVGEDAALDAALVDLASDFEAGHVAGGRDVADGLGGADDEDG